MSNIGPKVFELRRLRDMTQADLARLVGTERSFISRLETGAHVNLTVRVIEKIALALNTTPAELLR